MTKQPPEEVPTKVIERMLNRRMYQWEEIRGGRNSRSFRVWSGDSELNVAKLYHRSESDKRDRLGTEVRALRFLHANGIRDVPIVKAVDEANNMVLYEHIDGKKIPAGKVTEAHLDVAVDFLFRLREITNTVGAHEIPPASEACFSLSDMMRVVRVRQHRLDSVPVDSDVSREMRLFLHREFGPECLEIESQAKQRAREWDIPWDEPIGVKQMTLSPSDFGFHNAIIDRTGRVIFLDFEYFGHDDAAKMIADFMLHPGMELSSDSNRTFLHKALKAFQQIPSIAQRVEITYPLCALKWCLLMLNEFVPSESARREFADGWTSDLEQRKSIQLSKARRMLTRIDDDSTALFQDRREQDVDNDQTA